MSVVLGLLIREYAGAGEGEGEGKVIPDQSNKEVNSNCCLGSGPEEQLEAPALVCLSACVKGELFMFLTSPM